MVEPVIETNAVICVVGNVAASGMPSCDAFARIEPMCTVVVPVGFPLKPGFGSTTLFQATTFIAVWRAF